MGKFIVVRKLVTDFVNYLPCSEEEVGFNVVVVHRRGETIWRARARRKMFLIGLGALSRAELMLGRTPGTCNAHTERL